MIDLKYNRDGAHLWIDDANNLCVDDKHKYCIEYMRCILDADDDSVIVAIDPSGGPFISVGDKIGGKEIVAFQESKEGFKVLF